MSQGFDRQRFLAAAAMVQEAKDTRRDAPLARLPQEDTGGGDRRDAAGGHFPEEDAVGGDRRDAPLARLSAEDTGGGDLRGTPGANLPGEKGRSQNWDTRLFVYETVASTNQTAWELMAAGQPEPIAIALHQTAGRGQWGRQWQSAAGGLYLSVGVRVAVPVTHAAELTLCTAWGLATALRTIPAQLSGVTAGIPVQLKWLNDLVLEGRKLGGILTETRVQQQQIHRAVIGVGLNWTNPVPETGINLQSFLERQTTPLIESLELLTAIALHGIFRGLDYQQTGRMPAVLAAYLDLLAHRDRPLQWEGQSWAIVGITPTGALQVRQKLPETATDASIHPSDAQVVLIQPGTISLGYPL